MSTSAIRKKVVVTFPLTVALLAAVFAVGAAASSSHSKNNRGGGGQNSGGAWRDDFSSSRLNNSFWAIDQGPAPGYVPNDHMGQYDPSHVKIVKQGGNYYLRLLLTQQQGTVDTNPYGVISSGALVYSKNLYGYGTYTWRMRMSSTATTPKGQGDSVSGSVSAGFLYVNNSETEIDYEFSALSPGTLYMVNWLNPDPSTDPTSADENFYTLYPFSVSTEFHTYQFVWQPGVITFSVDGTVQATSTVNVPSAPAHFMINHWGTDSNGWGGLATEGVARYFYVDWVSYAPLP